MTLKQMFDNLFKGVKFNNKLGVQLSRYLYAFQTKNEEHRSFFGGVLLGVNKVNFTAKDYNDLYEVFGNVTLQDVDTSMDDVSDVNRTYEIESDPTNLMLIYVAYRFLNSDLPKKKALLYATNVMEIYFSRQYAILIAQYFGFQANENSAKMAYENMSNKYLIKKLDNWRSVMLYRAEFSIKRKKLKSCFKKFDHSTVKLVCTYSYTDVNANIKYIYNLLVNVINSDESMSTGSMLKDLGDGLKVVDVSNVNNDGLLKVTGFIGTSNFYNDILIRITVSLVGSLKEKSLVKLITHITTDDKTKRVKSLTGIINKSLAISNHYLVSKEVIHEDLPKRIVALKGMWLASIPDPIFTEHKDDVRDYVKASKIKLNRVQLAAVVNGINLYIYLLSIT